MMSAQDILAQLDPEQRSVVETLGVPLCVRAGAGTGKTRAITSRIAYAVQRGIYDPRNVMALTFTSRAAGELRSRLRDLGVIHGSASTFHSAALRQLSYFWPSAVGGKIPPIKEKKFPLVAEAAGRLGIPTDTVTIRDLAAEIEWSRVSLISPEEYPEVAAGRAGLVSCSVDEIPRLLRIYEEVKRDYRLLDFEDVLIILIGILIDRPDITRRVREQYRHFVVDEYQDISPVQYRLLRLWLGDRKDVCVVGDVSQTIYSFAGASSSYLADFPRHFSGAKVVELVRDYRSSPQIVDCANDVIASDTSRGAVRLVSQLPDDVPVKFHEYETDEDEAAHIAGEILSLRNAGVQLGNIAILYRTNTQSSAFETALNDAGIPFEVRGAERFFDRREVREAIISMRALARSGAQGSLASNVRTVLRQGGWREQAPERAGAARDRWSALNTLLSMAESREETRGATMAEFVAELEERMELKQAPHMDAVTLASLHAAKGLEWEAVFLAGVSEGLLPISLAKTPEAIAEERRLLYVGITRAKTHLHVSYVKGSGQRRGARKYSRFLDQVWNSQEVSRRRVKKQLKG